MEFQSRWTKEQLYAGEGGITGYEVRTTLNPEWKGWSFEYFLTKKEAENYVVHQKILNQKTFGKRIYYRIIPKSTIQKCRNTWCKRLTDTEIDSECMACEKIRGDVMDDARYEAEQEEMREEFKDEDRE